MTFKGEAIRIGSTAGGCELALDGDARIEAEHCRLECAGALPDEAPGWNVTVLARAPLVIDGTRSLAPGTRGRVADGAHLAIGDYTIELARAIPARKEISAVERGLLAAVVAGDGPSREVYADWLEQHGDQRRADYLRAQDAAHAGGVDIVARRASFTAAAGRVRELGARIDPSWRRAVGRPLIEGCDAVTFELACPMEWGSLAPTQDPTTRYCGVCAKSVFYCDTVDEARNRATSKLCVAIDLVAIRTHDDLRPVPRLMMVGQVVDPFT